MREEKAPGPWVMALAITGLFLGGGAVGDLLARLLAPGSWIAEAVGLFALPVAFAVAMQLWYGFAIFVLAPQLIALLFGRRPASPAGIRRRSLPGAFLFLPVSAAAGTLAGLVIGIVSSTTPLIVVLAVWMAVGVAHGWAGWRLAVTGCLVPPESV